MSDKEQRLREKLDATYQREGESEKYQRIKEELDKIERPTGSNGHSGMSDDDHHPNVPDEDR